MVDTEVERILLEIRERVHAERQQLAIASGDADAEAEANSSQVRSNGELIAPTSKPLARIEAHLTTTARAWDRLPPLVSNRSGALARLELWVKGHFKRATRWYAWEQINFNAAVHHALRDTLETLSAFEQELEQLRAEMRDEFKSRMQQFEHSEREQREQREELEAQRTKLDAQRTKLDAQRSKVEAQSSEIKLQQAQLETQSRKVTAQLSDLVTELREGHERLLDEQRVSLKQLSLEISEARTLLDRARREIESRLSKLETKRKS